MANVTLHHDDTANDSLARGKKIVFNGFVSEDSPTHGLLISRNIVAARARLRLNQASLAARMQALGYGWYPQTVGVVERGERRVVADELHALSRALDTSVAALLRPTGDDRAVAFPSGDTIAAASVARSVGAGENDGAVTWDGDRPVFRRQLILTHGEPGTQDPRPEVTVAPALPVAAAIVAVPGLGVLAGRRNDGKPPWTFISGEMEPGERIEDTILREVKEETGLLIRAGHEIGRRIHPRTGRLMIYVGAVPVRGTDVFVGDEVELAEVRWLTLAEADELLAGMFEPVRAYLGDVLGGSR